MATPTAEQLEALSNAANRLSSCVDVLKEADTHADEADANVSVAQAEQAHAYNTFNTALANVLTARNELQDAVNALSV